MFPRDLSHGYSPEAIQTCALSLTVRRSRAWLLQRVFVNCRVGGLRREAEQGIFNSQIVLHRVRFWALHTRRCHTRLRCRYFVTDLALPVSPPTGFGSAWRSAYDLFVEPACTSLARRAAAVHSAIFNTHQA